jgi:hypothetical protein
MHPDTPYFSILLYLTPDDFARQVESVAAQWVKIFYTRVHKNWTVRYKTGVKSNVDKW